MQRRVEETKWRAREREIKTMTAFGGLWPRRLWRCARVLVAVEGRCPQCCGRAVVERITAEREKEREEREVDLRDRSSAP